MGILQRIVRNEAMKVDPPEIYSWKVFYLACAVCLISPFSSTASTINILRAKLIEHVAGLLWRHVVRHGHRHHRRRDHTTRIRFVSPRHLLQQASSQHLPRKETALILS